VKAASLRLLAYAAFGGPRDSLLAAADRARRVINAYVTSGARARRRRRRSSHGRWRWRGPHWTPWRSRGIISSTSRRALQRGDRAEAGRQLGAINAIRASQRRGDVAIDATLAEVVRSCSTATARRQETGWSGSSMRFQLSGPISSGRSRSPRRSFARWRSGRTWPQLPAIRRTELGGPQQW
jgi:hypothetical protein